MRFVIKSMAEDGFGFPPDTDYSIFFPEQCEPFMSGPNVVVTAFAWGDGTFKFGDYVVNAVFEYKSIDFGYTEPLIQEVAARISQTTGKPNKYWQVPTALKR